MIQYAEHGEDTFLFKYIAEHNLPINKLIVDIGAYDGQFFSNSCAFIEDGWRGVLVEPHRDSFEKLTNKYFDNINVFLLKVAITKKRQRLYLTTENVHDTHAKITKKLTGIVAYGIPFSELMNFSVLKNEQIGILSIDAEGCDTDIVRQALPYKPQIIIIEANTPKDKEAQLNILKNDYTAIAEMGVNTIWLRNDLKPE